MKKVMLEIGHGPTPSGFDPGTIGVGGITEYSLNVIAANACAARLRDAGLSVTVLDESASLYALGQRAKGYDAFVSFHHNSFNAKAQGVEVLVSRQGNEIDKRLADAIYAQVKLNSPNGEAGHRKVKVQGLAVLNGADDAGVSACLVECYFIDAKIDVPMTELSRVQGIDTAVGVLNFLGVSTVKADTQPVSYPFVPARTPLDGSYLETVRALQGLGDAPKKVLSSAEFEMAVRTFQTKHSLAVDGDVGPKTLAALNLALTLARANKSEPIKTNNSIATLTRTDKKDSHGCYVLKLQIGNKVFNVLSGQPWAQNFRTGSDPKSVPGNCEPIPQNEYTFGDLEWANGKDNYDASHGIGLGPVKAFLESKKTMERGALYLHIDSNSQSSWGTAGCIGAYSINSMKEIVSALREYDPKTLIVDWGI
jgi:hypothetical protein